MLPENQIFVHFANLLSYPEKAKTAHADLLREKLAANPVYAQKLAPFFRFIERTPLKSIEEIFSNTFDLNAACCLEVGWHLYGEDYQRGQFLVNMRQSLEEENLPESIELPDHISHCLQLLAVLEPEDAEAFAKGYLQPAIKKILRGLDGENPYRSVVELLQSVLFECFGLAQEDERFAGRFEGNGRELPVLQSF